MKSAKKTRKKALEKCLRAFRGTGHYIQAQVTHRELMENELWMESLLEAAAAVLVGAAWGFANKEKWKWTTRASVFEAMLADLGEHHRDAAARQIYRQDRWGVTWLDAVRQALDPHSSIERHRRADKKASDGDRVEIWAPYIGKLPLGTLPDDLLDAATKTVDSKSQWIAHCPNDRHYTWDLDPNRSFGTHNFENWAARCCQHGQPVNIQWWREGRGELLASGSVGRAEPDKGFYHGLPTDEYLRARKELCGCLTGFGCEKCDALGSQEWMAAKIENLCALVHEHEEARAILREAFDLLTEEHEGLKEDYLGSVELAKKPVDEEDGAAATT